MSNFTTYSLHKVLFFVLTIPDPEKTMSQKCWHEKDKYLLFYSHYTRMHRLKKRIFHDLEGPYKFLCFESGILFSNLRTLQDFQGL